MAFEAKSYNSANKPQQSHGNSLIDCVLKENPEKLLKNYFSVL